MSMDVYELFIRPYTEKQWGRPASELPSSFAPNRVQIRDGDKRLFKDKYQGWPSHPNGYTALIDGLVHNPKITITHGDVRWPDLRDLMQDDDNYLVVTAPLDEFCNEAGGKLEWRGLRFGHCYVPDVQFATQAMVVNFPGPEFPWIRTHETKHASGQQCEGTVVSYEYTGAPSRYYPIETDKNRERQVWYESSLKLWTQGRVSFAGRLGTYRYMDMDEVIVDAISCAERIAATCDISYDPDGWWMR
jgi:UDP-galactopyranose mutase